MSLRFGGRVYQISGPETESAHLLNWVLVRSDECETCIYVHGVAL